MPSLLSLARLLAATAAGAWLVAGCNLLRSAAEAPGRIANAVMPEHESKAPNSELLLADLMRYSELIVFRVDEATHEFETLSDSPEAQLQASRWRLNALRVTTQLTTESNSFSALLDLTVLAATMGWLQEDYMIPEVWGEAARPMLTALRATEQDGWTLLERHLPAKQVADARAVLVAWREMNPKLEREAMLEFPSFSVMAAKLSATVDKGSSLLGLVGLDPLSGLEPAAREIEQTRQFAQRALFFAQRAPRIIGAEVDFRTLHARQSPEMQQLLRDTERVTTTLENVAATAASLPEALSREREAALKQVSEELAAQRAGLLADVAEARAPLESLMKETQATLTAARGLSGELTGTVLAVDQFLSRWDEPEGSEEAEEAKKAAEAAAASEPAVPSKPFDIVEYGDTAERVGHAVAELHALVAELDQRMPEAQRLLDEAAAHGKATVDHLLLRVAEVGLALIAAAGVTTWLVRRSGRSLARPS